MLYSSALKRIVITKVIRTHFWSKKFFHNFRCNIMQLYNFEHFSRFKVCILLWWIETELSFFNRSWNEDDLSPYVILKALSFKEYILLLRPLLWNIQTKGQYPNWDIIYAFITVFLFFLRQMCGAILADALSFWLAFLQRLFVWYSKESFEPKIIPAHSYFQIWWYDRRY